MSNIFEKAASLVNSLNSGFLSDIFSKMAVSWTEKSGIYSFPRLSEDDLTQIKNFDLNSAVSLLAEIERMELNFPKKILDEKKKLHNSEVARFLNGKSELSSDEIFSLGKESQELGIEYATIRRLNYLLRGCVSSMKFLKDSLERKILVEDILFYNPKLQITTEESPVIPFEKFLEYSKETDPERIFRKLRAEIVESKKLKNLPDGKGKEFFSTQGFLWSTIFSQTDFLRPQGFFPLEVENIDYPGVPAIISGFMVKNNEIKSVQITAKSENFNNGPSDEDILKARHAMLITGAKTCTITYVKPNMGYFTVVEESSEEKMEKAEINAQKLSQVIVNFDSFSLPEKTKRLKGCYSKNSKEILKSLASEIEILSFLYGENKKEIVNQLSQKLEEDPSVEIDSLMLSFYSGNLNPKGFLGIDIETTNQGATISEIIDLGFLVMDSTGKESFRKDIQFGLSPLSAQVLNAMYPIHNISNSDLVGLQTFSDNSEFQSELLELLKTHIMVVHNSSFEDSHFILNLPGYLEAKRNGEIQIVDTMKLSSWLGDPSESNSLENYARIHGILEMDESELHRGLDDARIMLEAMFKHLKGLNNPSTQVNR